MISSSGSRNIIKKFVIIYTKNSERSIVHSFSELKFRYYCIKIGISDNALEAVKKKNIEWIEGGLRQG
ncbi:hypothetical protein BpHYR1_028421 [Brachionus plicatilis]|uniref:Uncharacterized protein n=1 Tax=Brachionus plicatilis TaxID=10195 RepID=A0A3M7S2D2_BRAPC|nr:hypothetical protein BpHYR1_028421 [Brachionus plicatilis]